MLKRNDFPITSNRFESLRTGTEGAAGKPARPNVHNNVFFYLFIFFFAKEPTHVRSTSETVERGSGVEEGCVTQVVATRRACSWLVRGGPWHRSRRPRCGRRKCGRSWKGRKVAPATMPEVQLVAFLAKRCSSIRHPRPRGGMRHHMPPDSAFPVSPRRGGVPENAGPRSCNLHPTGNALQSAVRSTYESKGFDVGLAGGDRLDGSFQKLSFGLGPSHLGRALRDKVCGGCQ